MLKKVNPDISSPCANAYIKHIDGLRALAVLLVLLLHLNCTFFSGGFIGVDVFFVISGYLITQILVTEIKQTGKINFIDFYFRRAKRIFPALLFTLLCAFFAGILLLSAGHFKRFGGEIISSALSFSNFFFWKESGYFDLAAQFKPLLNTWSLGVEEQFYLLWPLLIVIFALCTKKRFLWVLIFILFILSLAANIFFQKTHLEALYYLMPFRVFEFCIGAIMVWLMRLQCHRNIILETMCAIGIIFIIYPAITYNKNTLFPSYNALLPCIGTAVIIYAGRAKYLGWFFSNAISRGIGLISYSLYLVHWPIIVFSSYYLSRDFSVTDKIFIFIGTLVLATLMYYFIEQPFRKYKPKTSRKKLKSLAFYLFATVIIATIGCSAYFSQGWLWRLPESAQQLLKLVDDPKDYHVKNWGGAGPFSEDCPCKDEKSDIADVVILGDSYASMLLNGFCCLIAKPYSLTTYRATGASCLNLPGLTVITHYQDHYDKSCSGAANLAIKKLQDNENSVLIIGYSWDYQLTHTGLISDHIKWNINTGSDHYSDYKPLIDALDGLRELIGDRKLIIMGNFTGAYSKSDFSCLTRPVLGTTYCQAFFTTKKQDDSNAGRLNINKVLQMYAGQHQNTYFIDPYQVFCPDDLCYSLGKDGIPYYSDNSHLSKTGSLYFISKIKNKLLDIINR